MKNKKGKGYFFIDINTTTHCNMRCKYCIEPFKENINVSDSVLDKFIIKIDEFLNSDIISEYDGITLGFWGGEPTTNPKAMEKLIKKYKDNEKVKFLVYSNGYKIDHIKPLIEKFKQSKLSDGSPKIFYQISYDGKAAHIYNRRSQTGKETVEEVRNSIKWAIKEDIPFSIKSTINRETFHLMDKCYEDIRDLLKGRNDTYFPTIDYLTNIKVTKEERTQYYKDLEKSLINIAEREIDYFKQNNRFFFSWFNKNLAICGAGNHGFAMDTDGTIYKCHGIFYSDHKKDNKVTSVYSNSFIEDIKESSKLHKKIFRVLPEACKNCYAEFCLKCNSMCYQLSNKKTFEERWNDYPVQPEICDLYRLATQVKFGMLKVLKLR